MERSHRWSLRSLDAFYNDKEFQPQYGSSGKQALYGIIQGGTYEDLRKISIEFNLGNNFFGLAIGGSLGSSKKQMYKIVQHVASKLGQKHPIHLLGIGDPIDIWNLVKYGIDTFDCVSPTRIARHGWALMKGAPGERLNLRNAKYAHDQDPIWPELGIPCSSQFSKGYIHHLFKANESLGGQLLAQHNIAVMAHLMREIRKAIKENTLDELQKEWVIE